MKLRTKLLMGFGIVLGIIAVLFGLSIYYLYKSNRNVEHSYQEHFQKSMYRQTIEYEINNISRSLRDLALQDSGSQDFFYTIDSIRESRKKLASAIGSLSASNIYENTRKLLDQMRNAHSEYVELQETCIELASSGKKAECVQLINEGTVNRNLIFEYAEELRKHDEAFLNDLTKASTNAYNRAFMYFFLSLLLTLLTGVGIIFWIAGRYTREIYKVNDVMNIITAMEDQTDLPRIDISSKDEVGELAASLNEAAASLEQHARQEKELNWLKAGIADIINLCQGVQDIKILADHLITKITPLVEASYGVFYIREKRNEKICFKKIAAYADSLLETDEEVIQPGQGLVGQSALENRIIMLNNVPGDYISISSGLGATSPKSIVLVPVTFEEQVVAVMELASLQPYSNIQMEFLERVATKNIGIAISRIESHMEIATLLKESQVLTEELQSQAEELQLQQEELRTFNEKLEEEYKYSEKRTAELELIKAELEEKAELLEGTSNYKTEFLSNMSHELRTPLNSLLILAQILMENKERNLTPSQMEYVKTIISSGNELLTLINDILDLSKIEAGKVTINPAVVELAQIEEYVERYFLPVARQKKLEFSIQMSEGLPKTIWTDEQQLLQILKNLLSNAFKFTERGSVSLRIWKEEGYLVAENPLFREQDFVMAFSVTDTGIGISRDKREMIFEAFQQANGTTARKYGGTGLGLAISQKLAKLLGGFIDLDSVEGSGSSFTLYLPGQPVAEKFNELPYAEAAATIDGSLLSGDDSVTVDSAAEPAMDEYQSAENENVGLEGKKILVVDDDMRNVFALTSALENQNMKAVFAEDGKQGIEMLQKNPDIDLVLMDIMMPEMDGYEALRRIRQIPEYANLPIIALTAKAMKNDREKCIAAGASDYISKPINLEQLFSLIKIWLYR